MADGSVPHLCAVSDLSKELRELLCVGELRRDAFVIASKRGPKPRTGPDAVFGRIGNGNAEFFSTKLELVVPDSLSIPSYLS